MASITTQNMCLGRNGWAVGFLDAAGRCRPSGASDLCRLPPSPSGLGYVMSRLRRWGNLAVCLTSGVHPKKLLSLRQQNLNPASASVIVQSGGAQRAGVFVVL